MNFEPPTAEDARKALDEMERHSLMPAGRALIVSDYIDNAEATIAALQGLLAEAEYQ